MVAKFLTTGRARLFLAGAAVLVVLGVSGSLGLIDTDSLSLAVGSARPPTAYALELEGQPMGWLAPSSSSDLGPVYSTDPTFGNPATVKISMATGAPPAFYQWITDSLDHPDRPDTTVRSGVIIASDRDYKEIKRFTFKSARLTEATFPAQEANSREQAYLKITFSPQTSEVNKKFAGATITSPTNARGRQTDFHVTIPGLMDFSQNIRKVKLLTIQFQPGGVVLPHFVVDVPPSSASAFTAWHAQANATKNGTLNYLDLTSSKALVSLEFHGLVPVNLAAPAGQPQLQWADMTMSALSLAVKR